MMPPLNVNLPVTTADGASGGSVTDPPKSRLTVAGETMPPLTLYELPLYVRKPDSELALAKRLSDFPGAHATGSPSQSWGPTTQSLKFSVEVNVNPSLPMSISGPSPFGGPTSRYRWASIDCAAAVVL